MRSNEFPSPGKSEVGGVDKSASNAGVRLAGSRAALPASSNSCPFWFVWVPPLVIGFIVGYMVHDLLDTLFNIGGMR